MKPGGADGLAFGLGLIVFASLYVLFVTCYALYEGAVMAWWGRRLRRKGGW